jgi:heat shock protein HslJ
MTRLLALTLALAAIGCSASRESPDLGAETWEVTDLEGGGVIERSVPSMAFTAEGQVSGSTGCNAFFGSYRLEGDRLAVGNVATTKRACPDPVMDQERRFLDVLARAERVELREDGMLVITGPDAEMRLRRQPGS